MISRTGDQIGPRRDAVFKSVRCFMDSCDWPQPQAGRRNAAVNSAMHERRSTCAVIVPRTVVRTFQPSTDGMARGGPFVQGRALASKIEKLGTGGGQRIRL